MESLATRRTFLARLAGAALLRGAAAVPLIDDPRFRRGLKVWMPAADVHVVGGAIKPQGAPGEPAWTAAQWYSHYNLVEARHDVLVSGSVRYFDGAKTVTFGVPGSPQADIIFAVNGHKEYGERAPAKGDAWVHLVMEQELMHHPMLPALHAVPFKIEYRLLKSQAFHTAGWDAQRHTAQFLLYITIQNGNHESKGKGDFLWFGVPMYDARADRPQAYEAKDFSSAKKPGTGRFIYLPGGEQFTTKAAKDGDWVSIDRDLLPLMRDALEAAWKAGFLQDSRQPEDYQLSGMNVGWEVTGPLDVAMQVRGLSLAALTQDLPQVAAVW